MINKNLKKILKNSSVKKLPDLKLIYGLKKLNPDIYYKITEFFEKDHFFSFI